MAKPCAYLIVFNMRWLDLFSGIGMYATGLEQAGHQVIGFCERDAFCQKILKKHYPMKPISWCIKSLNRELMASLAAHRAKIIRLEINPETVLMEAVQDSSGRWCEPFAWLDQRSGCWRMFQRSLDGGWAEFLGAWPLAGMIVNGIAYRREAQAHPTIALEHTFLPTPAANEGRGSSSKRFKGSPSFRGAKTSEALRTCAEDPMYLNPLFAELIMGLEQGYTELGMATPRVSLEN